MTELANSPLIGSKASLLGQSALSVGGPQIRNRATLGGNIVSASPAADTVVALVSLGATVVFQSARGIRKVLLEDLFAGPGQTKREKDELLTQIFFKAPSSNERGFSYKLGRRNALAVAVVNLGILAKIDETTRKWESVRIVLGSVAPTVMRAKGQKHCSQISWWTRISFGKLRRWLLLSVPQFLTSGLLLITVAPWLRDWSRGSTELARVRDRMMETTFAIRIKVNGKWHPLNVLSSDLLVDVLRIAWA
jgi:hypothetical protein